jgi:hypothetical protein
MSGQSGYGRKEMRPFKGTSINPGRVLAQACLFSVGRQKLVPEYTVENDADVEKEIGQIGRASCRERV